MKPKDLFDTIDQEATAGPRLAAAKTTWKNEPVDHQWRTLMTDQQPHTPTPAAFRRALETMASKYFVTAMAREQFLAEYDRMIAQVEASAEQRGAIKALRDAAESKDLIDYMHTYFVESGYAPSAVRATATYLHDRADQMEGDDE